MFEMLFFGTCSGTEPMKDMHHCAWAIKKNDGYYWFDAGENCSRTAHLMGENLRNVKNIFIRVLSYRSTIEFIRVIVYY